MSAHCLDLRSFASLITRRASLHNGETLDASTKKRLLAFAADMADPVDKSFRAPGRVGAVALACLKQGGDFRVVRLVADRMALCVALARLSGAARLRAEAVVSAHDYWAARQLENAGHDGLGARPHLHLQDVLQPPQVQKRRSR